ncbi:class F sortase [Phycicoccus sp. Soil748]|uniref:class F sortase n=1 Tax=Phycicoccus sp. Soil748 TaxID=1736397 RepID=UPI0009ECB854|nr:class F sortase [Phycicoccus sp. Soil748]
MAHLTRFGDRRGSIAAAVTVLLLLLGGGLVAKALTRPEAPAQPPAAEAVAPTTAPPVAPQATTPTTRPGAGPAKPSSASSPDFGPIMEPSPPVSLDIPSIGVGTKGIVDLALDKDGKLQAPTDFAKAGWYAAGPTPGEFGPAVIGAHVDSKSGPAVFYRLGALRKGAQVSVHRKDGSTARFVVDRVARYSKADFPTAMVYGDTKGRAELRLITCGGAFDHATGHYVDNIVAFAHLTS